MATILTDSNFAEIQAQGLPLVIDFSATWCGPCKKIAPIIDELAGEYEAKRVESILFPRLDEGSTPSWSTP